MRRPSPLTGGVSTHTPCCLIAELEGLRSRDPEGSTLGPEHRHWHRAYGSKTDAHRVFQWVLAGGHPPDDWDELLREARQAKRGCRRSRTDPCIRMAMSEAWTLSVLMVR